MNASEQGHRPLVVFIHGGAWMIGDKAWMRGGTHMQLEQFLHLLLRNGYAVASLNYRPCRKAYSLHRFTMKAAVRYLRCMPMSWASTLSASGWRANRRVRIWRNCSRSALTSRAWKAIWAMPHSAVESKPAGATTA